MTKPILVNSYPRSGSVFFSEALMQSTPKLRILPLTATVIHIPELIGIKEAITVTIVRDPVKAISSNIFKRFGVIKSINALDEMIEFEENEYLRYIEAAANAKAHIVNFYNLAENPLKEINKFLVSKELSMYELPTLERIEKVFQEHRYNDNITVNNGHTPRGVEKYEEYDSIYQYLKEETKLQRSKETHLSMWEGIKHD